MAGAGRCRLRRRAHPATTAAGLCVGAAPQPRTCLGRVPAGRVGCLRCDGSCIHAGRTGEACATGARGPQAADLRGASCTRAHALMCPGPHHAGPCRHGGRARSRTGGAGLKLRRRQRGCPPCPGAACGAPRRIRPPPGTPSARVGGPGGGPLCNLGHNEPARVPCTGGVLACGPEGWRRMAAMCEGQGVATVLPERGNVRSRSQTGDDVDRRAQLPGVGWVRGRGKARQFCWPLWECSP